MKELNEIEKEFMTKLNALLNEYGVGIKIVIPDLQYAKSELRMSGKDISLQFDTSFNLIAKWRYK